MERRDFLILAAAGTASTLALEGCSLESEYSEPLYIANDKYTPGRDYWYATVCGQCAAGCGVIVRKRDGNANKIEGNPLHPISRGKLCARGQAGLNELYNPDRIKHPLKRMGARGSGQFEKIEWDGAIKTVAERLNELHARGEARAVVWLEGSRLRGQFGALVKRFMNTYGSTQVFLHRPFSRLVEHSANRNGTARRGLPTYDLAKADFVLSFGARFLETWGSPVYYSRGFGEMRRGRRLRGRFVHAEPRMSLTAASADEWLPVRPGAEGTLALSIAYELTREKARPPFPAGPWGEINLADFDPEKTQQATGISPAAVRRLAKELAESQAVAVLGGDLAGAHTNGRFNLVAINYLGNLVNGSDQVRHFNEPNDFEREWISYLWRSQLLAQMADKFKEAAQLFADPLGVLGYLLPSEIKMLLIHGVNPLYSMPAAFKQRELFEKIPFIVSFSSFEDETTSFADLVLPDHTAFERWDDDEPREGIEQPIVSLAQPVVEPLYQTRHTGDVLLALAKQITPLKSEFKAASFIDLLKQAHLDDPQAEDAQKHWEQAVLRGGWWGEGHQKSKEKNRVTPRDIVTVRDLGWAEDGSQQLKASVLGQSFNFAGDEKDFPFHFLPYEHLALGDGRTANQPLLQELPDPVTAVTWGSWVEINPQTAARLGIAQGDLVKIESPHGSIEAPAVLYPAIRPDCVAMPAGQGHERYGRYATGRGANPLKILAPLAEPQTGALAWAATRVRISKSAGRGRLTAFGTNERLLEDRKDLKR
jgi:anaerobic selenocysteine-containing dehydrogenase